ncbi:MAG: hypothetical protein L0207_02210 [Chlamydiae bacterium]|nr:hypothetical protein [Chlamydiota bacterium]
MKIATIINFSTNEGKFLKPCIDHVRPFSEQIIAVASDHFFDGTPEDRKRLDLLYSQNTNCEFIEFSYQKEDLYLYENPYYWHNFARIIGYYFLQPFMTHVLFLDVDEIIDTKRFVEWLDQNKAKKTGASRFASYWYFKKPTMRAKVWEDCCLLVEKNQIHYELLTHPEERGGLMKIFQGNKEQLVLGLDGNPMIHHFSWVREKKEMVRKVKTWAHREERDWISLIEKEFSRTYPNKIPNEISGDFAGNILNFSEDSIGETTDEEKFRIFDQKNRNIEGNFIGIGSKSFTGRDFVHNYELEIVQPFIELEDPFKQEKNLKKVSSPHVRKLSIQEMKNIDMELRLKWL